MDINGSQGGNSKSNMTKEMMRRAVFTAVVVEVVGSPIFFFGSWKAGDPTPQGEGSKPQNCSRVPVRDLSISEILMKAMSISPDHMCSMKSSNKLGSSYIYIYNRVL